MFTAKCPEASNARRFELRVPSDHRMSGGSSDSELN
jgi:hypothetical protein